jgi:hypothetical protein
MKKLKAILMTVPFRDFDQTFPTSPDDPLACVLGRLTIPPRGYDADLLLDFYQRFKAVQEGVPDCKLCDFLKAQRQRLRRREIDLTGHDARQRFASNPGLVRQSEQAEVAAKTRASSPACSWCQQLGDTIIALQAGRGVTIVTADRTFVALGELLGVPVILLSSLAELKRRASVPAEVPDKSRP